MKEFTPYIQKNIYECGLCSIAAFLHTQGIPDKLDYLRKNINVSSKGINMVEIMNILDSFGYISDGVELEIDDFHKRTPMPFIAHYTSNHWVLVLDSNSTHITTFNPTAGINQLTSEEFFKNFSGKGIFAYKKIVVKNQDSKIKTISNVFTSIPNIKKFIFNIAIISIFVELVIIIFPYYTQIAIDHVIITSDQELLNIIAISAILLIMLQGIFTHIKTKVITHLSNNIRLQLLNNICRHFYNLPMLFYAQNSLGDLKSRVDSAESISKSISDLATEIFVDFLICTSSAIIMLFYSSNLAAISLILGLTIALIKIRTYMQLIKLNGQKILSEVSKDVCMIENIRAIHILKMNDGIQVRTETWIKNLLDTINIDENISLTSATNKSLQIIFGGISYVSIIYVAINLIEKQEMTIGLLFAYIVYHQNFLSRIGGLTDRLYMLTTLKDHFTRVLGITSQKIEGNDNNNQAGLAFDFIYHDYTIFCDSVSFKYPNSIRPAVSQIKIYVKKDDFFVLSGPSGSGKTTVLCILAGIYIPTTGEITAFGRKITSANLFSYRQNIGFVFQNEEFFSGTIIENISMFSKKVDMDKIKIAAKIACIHDEIMGLTNGYNSILGENGMGLSGGQKQRIAIARAVYRNPKILFLDEATSQLDDPLEKSVIFNLRTMKIPIIMATHSVSIKQMASNIFEFKI